MSIPSRVLISSNLRDAMNNKKLVEEVSIPSRVLISSNENSGGYYVSDDNVCQSLQGFSYLLTVDEMVETTEEIKVSIPSRVLISSNL